MTMTIKDVLYLHVIFFFLIVDVSLVLKVFFLNSQICLIQIENEIHIFGYVIVAYWPVKNSS